LVVVATDDRRFGSASELPQWLADAMPSPKAPVVIGVVGDPNHGKSVFSAALDRYRTSKNQDGWILDCDGQAPTPHWYLSMLEQNNPEAIQLREQSKRPWTSEMEERIAKQICMGRRIFEILIADLPGGNHKASPPQRVPPGRERIFNEVDALILLENIDGQREAAWREALLRHGLDGRIAAVLTSRDPQVAPALSVRQNGDLWRGAIEGLDRNRPDGELDEAFRAGLDQLWPALLDFARRRPARG
jgi:hypothetical protein